MFTLILYQMRRWWLTQADAGIRRTWIVPYLRSVTCVLERFSRASTVILLWMRQIAVSRYRSIAGTRKWWIWACPSAFRSDLSFSSRFSYSCSSGGRRRAGNAGIPSLRYTMMTHDLPSLHSPSLHSSEILSGKPIEIFEAPRYK